MKLKNSDDWLSSQAEEIEATRKLQHVQNELNKIKKFDDKIKKLRSKKKISTKPKWLEKNVKKEEDILRNEFMNENKDNEDDTEFLLENIDASDDEKEEEIENKYEPTKIFICSRTHSQLAQLVHEVERSAFADNARIITLASRQNYCINPSVNKLNFVSLINERYC